MSNLPDVTYTNLPKWPGLVVTGPKVSEELAAQINIRTSGFSWFTNDQEFGRQLNEAIGVVEDSYYNPSGPSEEGLAALKRSWKQREEAAERYGILQLNYLNNHNIVSAYVGGPYGWCSWSGHIHANSYNIGKWPSGEEVYEDWQTIARAFPTLELTSQLMSGETCEEGIVPVIEYRMKNGEVTVHKPTTPICSGEQMNAQVERELTARFSLGYYNRSERGVTIEKFREALKLCDTRG